MPDATVGGNVKDHEHNYTRKKRGEVLTLRMGPNPRSGLCGLCVCVWDAVDELRALRPLDMLVLVVLVCTMPEEVEGRDERGGGGLSRAGLRGGRGGARSIVA